MTHTDVTNKPLPTSSAASGLVTQISMGYSTTCAVLNNGKADCWGAFEQNGKYLQGCGNSRRRLLYSSQVCYQYPYQYANNTRVSVGYKHACSVMDDESVWCWGDPAGGLLGDDLSIMDSSRYRLLAAKTNTRRQPVQAACRARMAPIIQLGTMCTQITSRGAARNPRLPLLHLRVSRSAVRRADVAQPTDRFVRRLLRRILHQQLERVLRLQQ